MSAVGFSYVTAWAAEGARVGIVTCLRCGAAILLDPRESSVDALSVHRTWHEKGDDK